MGKVVDLNNGNFDDEDFECDHDHDDDITPLDIFMYICDEYGVDLTPRVAYHMFSDLMEELVDEGFLGTLD